MKAEPPFLPAIDISPWVYSIILTSRTRLKVLVRNSSKSIPATRHRCPYCGFVADRDYNAAVNIHRVGMEQPFEPVEPGPLHHISVVQVLAMKQEAPHR
ncbi:MAG TPA: zinc ribbon domain-containing protein [Methanoculleus sp.]|nr:zinc ribbon domain-containing protein [Methanoculleus sp.]